jgi:ribosomal protein L11 methyltransferase
MKWTELAIKTTPEATEAISALFIRFGSGGVEIEDPDWIEEFRKTGGWEYSDLPPSVEKLGVRTVRAYFPQDDYLAERILAVREGLEVIRASGVNVGEGILLEWEMDEEDWAHGWKAYFKPLRVGAKLVVKPSWEEYEPKSGDIVLELDPGMAFGTGTHPTTRLCMEALEKWLEPGTDVLDVGCGSGILAVTAAKLGAAGVDALDIDPTSIKVTIENVHLNDVESVVRFKENDLLAGWERPVDVIVSNIVADIIIRLSKDAPSCLVSEGLWISGGIIDERRFEVENVIREAGFYILEVMEEAGWCVIVARRKEVV